MTNMMKASTLLKTQDPQHCLVHSMHLLLTESGITSMPGVLEKTRNIVTNLTHKSYVISNDSLFRADIAVYDKLHFLAEANEIMDLDEKFPYVWTSILPKNTAAGDSDATVSAHKHRSLKMQVATRWNCGLQMLESVDDLQECAMNMIKVVGKPELLLNKDESDLLHQLVLFLKPFRELTELMRDANNSSSIIPLVKQKFKDNCIEKLDDLSEIKELKHAIVSNIEKRLKLSVTVTLSCIFDPSVRVIFTKDHIVSTLKKCCKNKTSTSKSTCASSSVTNSLQELEVQHSSKKQKLLMSLKSSGPDKPTKEQLLESEIARYLMHKPSSEEIDSHLFWKNNGSLYPQLALGLLAQEYLAIPSSSVPAECIFSTTGLLMN